MRLRFTFAVIAALSVVGFCALAQADTIAYLSAGAAPPANLDVDLANAAIGTSGSFDVWVRTDLLVAGVSLDIATTGPAIKFTSAVVPNFTGPRWANVANGTVAGDGLSITGFEAFAVPGFGSNGMNPANTGTDDGYNAGANAYKFATINYSVLAAGDSVLKLTVGANEFGVDGPIFLGTGDAAVAATGAGSAGLTSALADGMISVAGAGGGGVAPLVADFTDSADLNETINTIITTSQGDAPITWSALKNPTFTPLIPGKPGAFFQPSWNPATQAFSWNTKGSSRGDYTWEVMATNATGMDTGLITVHVPNVPEPATFALLGMAAIGLVGCLRRRS